MPRPRRGGPGQHVSPYRYIIPLPPAASSASGADKDNKALFLGRPLLSFSVRGKEGDMGNVPRLARVPIIWFASHQRNSGAASGRRGIRCWMAREPSQVNLAPDLKSRGSRVVTRIDQIMQISATLQSSSRRSEVFFEPHQSHQPSPRGTRSPFLAAGHWRLRCGVSWSWIFGPRRYSSRYVHVVLAVMRCFDALSQAGRSERAEGVSSHRCCCSYK